MGIRLSDATLGDLPESIIKPTYDRTMLTPGIVHIGLGNFHRAHQSWYLHRLFEKGLNKDWAIIGAGVRPYDEQMRQKMKAQDYLTTLIELDPSGKTAEVVGSMIDYVPVQEGNAPLIKQMADPAIRIVALTVTEGGYYIDLATKGFDAAHPDMQYDAANPDKPRTAFGAMIAALKMRRDQGVGPFTGQSCDNLQGNGTILHQTLTSLARLSDPELADWIDANCTFPNSMVDCIVPATGPKELALAEEFGITDSVPVTHEQFRQWVIEDKFCAGRPDWDKAGATISDRVHDYETMKIRILNGGHQLISDLGELLSLETISGCMTDPKVHAFFQKVQKEEIVPYVQPVPEFEAIDYLDLIDRRFSNPDIVDTTRRVAFDGSSRHSGFLAPSIRDALAKGGSIEGLALASAFWARYCQGTRNDGSAIEPNDPLWADLNKISHQARKNPHIWLEMRHIYGDLADNAIFANAFERWLLMIGDEGIYAALNAYLKQT